MRIRNCFGSGNLSISDEQKRWTPEEIGLLALCIAAALLMFARCFFGVEFTDEAYYVSDALAIMHGNLPYAYDASLVAGQSFIPIVFYAIYESLVPSLEGIFLYSRLCYVLFRMSILLAIYHLLKQDLVRKWRLLIILAMIPFMGSIIQNFSYNTIAAYCTLLVSVLLYSAQKNTGKRLYFKLALSGFFSAISVFAHPVSAIAVIVNFILIFINSKKTNRFKCLLTYCLGGILEILVVFLPIICSVGIDKVLYGFETFLFHGTQIEKKTLSIRLLSIKEFAGSYCRNLLVGTLVLFLFLKLSTIRKASAEMTNRDKWLLSLGITLCITLCVSFRKVYIVNFWYLSGILFIESCVLICFTYHRRRAYAWYFLIPNVLYVAFLVLTTQTALPRFYYCIPLLVVILHTMFQSKSNAVKGAAAILALSFALMQGYKDYEYVYQDKPLSQLNVCVEEGVYKGIYTTSDRARDVVALERFLSENIALSESVAFRDNAPVAYLMCNKNICDVRTWDEMQWAYKSNNPTSVYRYYKNKEAIPDVIAYVDLGGEAGLSIDNPSDVFQYNDFVNSYYYLDDASLDNQTFRVKIYRNNGEFRYNFDELIGSVREWIDLQE